MEKLIMNKDFFEGLAGFVENKCEFSTDSQEMLLTVKAFYEYIAEVLAANKSESEEFELELPGYITFKFKYIEDEDKFVIVPVAQEEMKKRIKDDASLI